MNKHVKRGLLSMSIWILFLTLLFGSYLLITKQPFTYFIDEETGGFISGAFFVAWALIWFAIGRHFSMDYDNKKAVFMKKYKDFDEVITSKTFEKAYFADIARILATLFAIAVPFYVAANVRGAITLKNCIYIGILMILSMICYRYYKKNYNKEIKL